MTPTASTMHSTDPLWITELMPRARKLAADMGEVPSRNRLMRELRIGAEKAKALRAALVRASAAPETDDELDTADSVVQSMPDPVPPTGAGGSEPGTATLAAASTATALTAVDRRSDPGTATVTAARPVRSWPVLILAAPALVAIWSGWVGLGGLTGFGPVHPLPGIWDSLTINTAITLPIGVETYAAYALRVWLSGDVPAPARRFAKWSALGALLLGAAGQIIYHLMIAAGMTTAPWPVTTLVSCLPVVVLGMGAALAHLLNTDQRGEVITP